MLNASEVGINAPANAPVELVNWVAGVAELTQPDTVCWCDGSTEERDRLTAALVESSTFIKLNESKRPGSFLVRSHPTDVGPADDRTFICAERPEEVGPTSRWADPAAMKQVLAEKFNGSMSGRTMYVIPFAMGPVGSSMTKLGIEITDSPYVVVAMRVLAHIGTPALDAIAQGGFWVPAVHSVGYPLRKEDGATRPDVPWPCNADKYVAHFPDSCEIWSYGSGQPDNAVLAHRSFALRIASVLAEEEGWLAEHMQVVKFTSPAGEVSHVAGAFPRGCAQGFATMRPTIPEWHAETISVDMAWLRSGADGRLYAVNPEIGCAGFVADASKKTNRVILRALASDAIFINVALTDDGDVWWDGLTDEPPAHAFDWQGNEWTPAAGTPAAHTGASYLVGLDHISSLAKEEADPEGVPIDLIVFGGRRASVLPLVTEAYSWEHGVLLGATLAAETVTADGAHHVRRDPFAMLSYCGYNMADYWTHWLRLGRTLGEKAPRMIAVNWFRRAADGTWAWPGGAENVRAIEWALRPAKDATPAVCGRLPNVGEFNVDRLDLTPEQVAALFALDMDEWVAEADAIAEYFDKFGNRLPAELTLELADLRGRINAQKM